MLHRFQRLFADCNSEWTIRTHKCWRMPMASPETLLCVRRQPPSTKAANQILGGCVRRRPSAHGPMTCGAPAWCGWKCSWAPPTPSRCALPVMLNRLVYLACIYVLG